MAAADIKSDAFFKAIHESSLEQKTSVISEIEAYKAQQLAQAKAAAEKKYEEYILAETANFASEDGMETEKRSAILKKEVIDVRTGITEKVFSAVRAKLADFTKTGEYGDLLEESAKKMAAICADASLVIYMREQDLPYADRIKAVSPTISVRTDASIGLGGIYGISAEKSIKLNDLLETRLSLQRDWFYENSGLSFNH